MTDHQPFKHLAKRPTGPLGAWIGSRRGVLAPDVTAPGAPVAADRDQQGRRAPAQRLVGQLARDRVPDAALAATAPAPLVRLEALLEDLRAELVQAGERGQVRSGEGSQARRGLPDGQCEDSHPREISTSTWWPTRRPSIAM